MFTNFSSAERAIRFPQDRRRFIGINPYAFALVCGLFLATFGLAVHCKKYGAPLRLRIENQLGYKMVKWINKIES